MDIKDSDIILPDLVDLPNEAKETQFNPATAVAPSPPQQPLNIDASNESEIVRVAEEEGLPVNFVRDNFESVNYLNASSNKRRSLEDKPATLELYDNLDETWASADYDELGLIETVIRDIKQGWTQGGDITGLGGEGWNAIINGPDSGYSDRVSPYRESMQVGRTADTGWVVGIPGSISETLPIIFDVAKISAAGGAAGAAAGAVAGTIIPGAGTIAGAVAGAAWGLRLGAGAMFGGAWGLRLGAGVGAGQIEAGIAYDEYIQMADDTGKPMGHDAAAGAAILVGIVNGGLEMLSIERIARTIPGSEKFLGSLSSKQMKRLLGHPTFRSAAENVGSKLVSGAIGEGIIEAVQELVTLGGQLGAAYLDEGDYDKQGPTLAQAREVAWKAFRQGSQVGFGLSVPGASIGVAVELRAKAQVETNLKAIEILNSAEITGGKAHPRKLQKAIERMRELHNATDTVYIEAEQLETFFQEVDMETLRQEAPGIVDALEESRLTGGDVAVPLAEYIAIISPSANAGDLADYTKFNAEEYTKNQLSGLQEEIAAIEKGMDDDASPTTTIFQDVQGMLVDTGYSPDAAAKMASLWESIFEAMGDRLPITAQEFFNNFNLQIQSQMTASEDVTTMEQADPFQFFEGEDVELAKKEASAFKSKETIVYMTPDEFLALAEEGFDERKAEDVRGYAKFSSIPYLNYDTDGGIATVVGHEGRHRAREIKNRGGKVIPVRIIGGIRLDQQDDKTKFDYVEVFPTTLQAETQSQRDKGEPVAFPIKRGESGFQQEGDNLLFQEAVDVVAENLVDTPRITVKDLVGKKIFPIFADLTAAGTVYRGMDGVAVDPTELLGGPHFPMQEGFNEKEVVWAFQGKGTTTKAINKSKQADYVVVLAMAQDAHRSNATVAKVLLDTFEGFAREGHISPEVVQDINERVRSRAKRPNLAEFPGFENPKETHEFLAGLSFEDRAEVVKVLESKQVQGLEGVPNLRRILNVLREADFGGVNQGDALMVLDINTDNPIINFEDEGVRRHPSYAQGVRGSLVGKMQQPISWEILFGDVLKDKPRKDWYITMDRAQPIVEVTQEMADKAAQVEGLQTPTTALASMVSAVIGDWSATGVAVNKGGLSPTIIADAIKASPAQATLTHYTAKEIAAGAKDGSLIFYRLSNSETYVGIKTGGMVEEYMGYGLTADQVSEFEVTDADVAMVGVINNTQGAGGLGAAQVLKAIEEGVTILDAYSVPSAKYPNGFLPAFYSELGFEKTGEIPFNADYLSDEILAFWRENKWDESKGYPPIAVMKWRGEESERASATTNLITEATTGYERDDINPASEAAVESIPDPHAEDQVGSGVDGGGVAGSGGNRPVNFTSKLVQGIKDASSLTSDVASSYGITNEALQSIQGMTGEKLFQGARGYIQFNKAKDFFSITLTGKANLSTFLHESGHFFLEMLQAASDMEGADPSLSKDMAILRDWMGVAPGGNIETEHHEMFARGFEAYLMDGKAPNSKVAEAFDRFKGWLTRIYKSISSLNVQLTDEVRQVMDRMVGVEEGFAQLAAENPPMFTSAKEMGVSQEEYDAYLETHRKAMMEGQNRVESAVMNDIAKQRGRSYNDRKKELMEQAAKEVDDQPVYRVRNFLSGRWGKDHPNLAHFPEYLFGNKLDSDSVRDLFDGKVPPKLRSMVSEGTGMPPDEIAPLFGYKSGMSMLEDLNNTPSRGEAILSRVEVTLDQEFGDIIKDGKLEEESIDAMHNGKMTSVIEAEMKRVGSKAAVATANQRRLAKYVAQKRVRAIPILTINRSRFLQAEKKSAKAASEAVSRGDFIAAHRHKVQQLVAHYMYKEASVAQKRAEIIRKDLVKFGKKPRQKAIAKAGLAYLDAINALLDGVELTRRSGKLLAKRINLEEFMEREAEAGIEVFIPEELRRTASLKNYRQMSLGELESLKDTIDHIWSTAKLKNMIVTKHGRQKLKEVVAQLVENMKKNAAGAKNQVDVKDPNKKNIPRWMAATLVKPEFIAKWIDGETAGFAHSVLFNPLADAQHAANDMAKEFSDKLKVILKKMKTKSEKRDLFGKAYTRDQIIAIALNMGNRGNLDKLLAGRGWDEATLVKEMQRFMDKDDWANIQEIWDLVNTLWPEIERISMDAGMGRPPKVSPSELRLDDIGITLNGGYYPIAYDPSHSTLKHTNDQTDSIFQNNLFNPGVSAGFKEARVTMMKPPEILLSLNVLTNHVGETIHFVTHYEAVKNIEKVIDNPEFKTQFKDSFGNEYYNATKDWLKDVANRGVVSEDTTWVPKVSQYARLGMSVVAMGFSFSSAIMQGFGVFTTADEIGVVYTLKGMKTALDPRKYKDIIELSGEIRHITKNMDREIADAINQAFDTNNIDKALRPIKQFAFMHIAYAQRVVNVATFDGARQKAIDDGKSYKESIIYAEAVVRMTQTGAGAKDLARIQAGHEVLKLLTPFYSYFSVLYNRYHDMARDVGVSPMSWLKFSQRMMWLTFLPKLTEIIMKGEEPEDDDDWLTWYLWQSADLMATTVPVVRDFAGLITSEYSPDLAPALSIIADVAVASGSVSKLISEDYEWGDLTISQQSKMVSTISKLTHMPTKTPWRIYEAMYNDEVEDPFMHIFLGAGREKK